jgi:hypothetical protein
MFRRCTGCHQWFAVLPGISRSDRRVCSGACRVEKFRRDHPQSKIKSKTKSRQRAKKGRK